MMINVFLFIVAFLAYFVKGITGFGNTLVMATLYSFFIPNRITTPIDLLFSIPTNTYLVRKGWRSIQWKMVVPLSALLLIGAIPGTFLLKTGNDRFLKSMLGVVIIGIGVEMLTRKDIPREGSKMHPALLIGIGIFSGILAGLYGISAPLVAYISRTTSNRSEFRANLCCVFLADNLFRLIYYAIYGIISLEIVKYTVWLLPAVLLGMFAGVKVDKRLKEATVRKTVIIVLMFSGMVLLLKSIFL